MADVVQLWIYLSSTPLFGLAATLAVYAAAAALYDRLGRAPWANPVLLSILVIGGLLVATRTPYAAYFAGAQFVHVLLGPAVVALGWPLWVRRAELRRRGRALVIAAVVGGAAGVACTALLGAALGLPRDVLRSLAVKSVTSPVAAGIAERIGGVPALAAVFAILTGIVGAVLGRSVFERLRVRDMAARGFAMGTAAHGIGAARAVQVDAEAGAYAGIALGLQALAAALLLPLVAGWIG